MSAIYGIFNRNGDHVNPEAILSMRQSLGRYQADTSHIWSKESISLGCHFQMITPESTHEILPFYQPVADLAISADAIIDNREELFNRLLIPYYDRARITDSQLILKAYEKWGNQCPKYLVGDFAFVIWNGKKRELFCARDQRGTRTLYYHKDANSFSFCTIMKPLIGLENIGKKLNDLWLAEFLSFPYIFSTVSTETSVYKNISQIPPAHSLSINEKGYSLQKYWSLDNSDNLLLKSDGEYEEALITVLRQAVQSHLRSLRPVGIRLSGGLDSGTVASLAAKELKRVGKVLNSFSYVPIDGFQDWTPKHYRTDETQMISATVKFAGNINPNYSSFHDDNAFSVIDGWLDILEQPYKFVENGFWIKGMDELAKRQEISVFLNGGMGNLTISQGGNFKSYVSSLFKQQRWGQVVREIAAWRKTTNKSLSMSLLKNFYNQINGTSRGNSDTDTKQMINDLTLINPAFAEENQVKEYLQEKGYHIGSWGLKDIDFFYPIFFSHQGATFSKSSLYQSIWHRDPTSDLRVIELCNSIPEEQFVLHGLKRSLIRRATRGILPDEIRLNQQVSGYQGADWFHRITPIWNQIEDELLKYSQDDNLKQYIDVKKILLGLSHLKNNRRDDLAESSILKGLFRSLIFGRFIKNSI